MYSRKFYNKNLRNQGRELRNNMTPAENKIWKEFLRYLNPRVHRQRSMGNFIVDFYIPKAKLVIEIDGEIHTEKKIEARDLDRTRFLNSLGLSVIRFTNDQVFHSFKKVCISIMKTIHNHSHIL